jgi:hypothetical protein
MAAYTTEDIDLRIRRWIVPAPKDQGASIGAINEATSDACRAYREAHGLTERQPLDDAALHFHVRGAEIVIEFAVEAREP